MPQAKQERIELARQQAAAEAAALREKAQQQQREQELLAKIQLEQKMKVIYCFYITFIVILCRSISRPYSC